VEDILNASDVAVSASRWEGFPNNLVEAMAAGKPVIATAVGGVPELVVHGETGVLVPAGDRAELAKAMLLLHGSLETCNSMGRSGRQIALQEFDVRAMARRHEELYRMLLEKRQRRSRL
jgi:glycosyltransferase involved in cell wall biosynthesis